MFPYDKTSEIEQLNPSSTDRNSLNAGRVAKQDLESAAQSLHLHVEAEWRGEIDSSMPLFQKQLSAQ
jgi:hypothetical protein